MNARLLKSKMVERGITEQELASNIGIDASTFYRKKSGLSDFNREEIKTIKRLLSLSADDVDRIFFED